MALHKDVEAVLNKQLEKEFDAEMVYLGLAIHFEKELFKGFAAWFRKQAGEERTHAMKIMDYMLDRNGNPLVPAVSAPKVTYGTPLDAFRAALAHERANTAGIYDCLATAHKVNDPATAEMLQWFVKEQVEEEKNATEIVEQLKLIDARGTAILMLDHRLGKRGGED